MALSYAHGAVQWLAADAATTTYTVSGLAFQPKALKFYASGIQSAVDAASQTLHSRRSLGFATSTTSRRAVGTASDDASAAANCGSIARNDCVIVEVDGAGATTGLLDLSSVTSDGFVLIVDDAAAFNNTVFWEAWGGTDITVATVGDIAEPAAIGVQTYTVTGFTSGATDQVVMLAGVQSVSALNTGEAQDSGFYIGFATNTTTGNVVLSGNSDDASATMDTRGYCKTSECLAMVLIGGGDIDARAQLTQFNADNFGLDWLARAVTNRRSIFMAIKGGNWSAGSYTIDAATLNATATVSGLAYAPIGLTLIGRRTAEQSAGLTTSEDRISIGSGTSPTSRRSIGTLDETSTASSEINHSIQYDQVLTHPSAAGTQAAAFDINAMNSDGFQIIVDVAGGVANEWQGYLTFGSAAGGGAVIMGGLLLMGVGA